ncbi:MAG: hypothetical protein LUD18_07480 [Lachnospiraceae bacterium]|nr:hypothetical protein [Lachnospiraceae bacterium]
MESGMETDKMNETTIGEGRVDGVLRDDDLDQVAGGASAANLTGEFHIILPKYKKMNKLWNEMYEYGEYGKAVKELVDAYVDENNMQYLNFPDWRWYSRQQIEVYAKNELVTVNGCQLTLQ